jgi:hypothetical protein
VKKVQLSLKRGSETASFTLYDSVESAYYLKDEPPYPDGFEEEYRKIITLKQGDILEVEWVGSEWIFDDGKNDFPRDCSVLFEKYDKVRIGKITPLKGTEEKFGLLEVYSGWLVEGDIPWYKKTTPFGLKITQVKGKVVSKFDFSQIFLDPKMGLVQQEAEEDIVIGDILS